MPKNRKMISVGIDKLDQILKEIGVSKSEIGNYIGLTKGGFWHVTHKTGKMNIDNWSKLQILYKSRTGKVLLLGEESIHDFSKISDIELVKELRRRGWKVICTAPDEESSDTSSQLI